MKRVTKTAWLCAGLCALAGTAAADPYAAAAGPAYGPAPYPAAGYAPAPYADGLTVYSRPAPYRVPDHVQELSAGVAYDDLDLATREGQAELNWRIARTADDLCDRLGEGEEIGRNSSVLPTCQASARDRARGQVRRAVREAEYAAAYAPPAYPAYPPAAYAPPGYGAQPTYYAPPPVYAQPQAAWTPPPCNCGVAWAPPRPGW